MIEQNDFPKQTAIFIDIANCRNVDLEQMLTLAREHGELVVMQAYGNFANSRHLGTAAQKLFLLGVRLIHCPAWRNGSGEWKSTADETVMNDVRTLLHTDNSVKLFIICSGDGHYIPTISEIKKQGKEVIVMANPRSASRWIEKAANKFIPLAPVTTSVPREIFAALVEAIRLLQKTQHKSAVYPANVKVKMIELRDQFNEKKYRDRKNRPFKRFTDFLKEAEAEGWIRLIRQDRDILITTASKHSKAA